MKDCPFCNLAEERLVYKGIYVSALFSYWPVSDYHLLIIPNRHVYREEELNECEVLDLHKVKVKLVEIIREKTRLMDYNFGVNQGEAAGQTISHLHYHLIFRKVGDVEDPIGGVRNIIPNMGNYRKNPIPKREEDVKKWTEEIKPFMNIEEG